jgi:L-seryl-tRNA(Ser) seleniumtransferase
MSDLLRRLPPLNALLDRRSVRSAARGLQRKVLVALAREVLEEERAFLRAGRALTARYGSSTPDRRILLDHCERALLGQLETLLRPQLRRVINATGVLLHTNLGRARLSQRATAEVARVASQPVALEVDLESGRRGSRNARIDRWLRLLTGAGAGLAVNNGAAALWLCVHGLARHRGRVLISRGEQVAIGGSFRMPELMRTTRARLVEVGTTNRTSADDYARELGEGDLVVKVHPSNYRIEGFHEEAPLEELAALCREHGASLIFDAGSGSLYNFRKFGLEGEMPVEEALEAGADLITFSGDKLLGGPQAGLIVGREELVRRLARHPLQRALRCDKMVLAALETTLATYAETPGRTRPDLPLFDALGISVAELGRRARALAERLAPRLPAGWSVKVVRSTAAVGGGSFAEHAVSSVAVELVGPDGAQAEGLHRALRRGEPAVLTRVSTGRVAMDLRSLSEDEIDVVVERVGAVLGSQGTEGPTPAGV